MKRSWKLIAVACVAALALAFGLAACSGSSSSSSNAKTGLVILYEKDDSLINNYSLLAVNPDAPFADADGNAVSDVKINTVGAKAFIDWMLRVSILRASTV